MKQNTYTTNEIASIVGIHVNTVRFYEEIGFITRPERKANGYRIFTQLQLEQCLLVRLAMKSEVLQNGLRKKAVDIVRRCAALDFEGAMTNCEEYRLMIESELRSANAAIDAVEDILHRKTPPEANELRRKEAARHLGITTETLRTWERSGLLAEKHYANGYRMYNASDLQRLSIIRTLRCANYSLSAILRLMNALSCGCECLIEDVLNIPQEDDDIVSVCDRLIISLQSTLTDARTLLQMIQVIEKTATLH